jgi:hypothetical protein
MPRASATGAASIRRRWRSRARWGSNPSPAGTCCCRVRVTPQNSPVFCLALKLRTRRRATRLGRAVCRVCCRQELIGSSTRPMRGSPQSHSRSAPTTSRATASRTTRLSRSRCRRASMAPISRVSSRRCFWRATSSTRRPTTWGRPSSRMRCATSRVSMTPRSSRSWATISCGRTSRSFTRSAARRRSRRG